MSRHISFFRVKNGSIERVTSQIAWLAGYVKPGEYKQGKSYLSDVGLNVSGCGMDMIFDTLYNCMLYKQAKNWNQRYNTL